VCVTHDRGNVIVFAYIGGHRNQRAKRFNPRKLGGVAAAVRGAAHWRAQQELEAAA